MDVDRETRNPYLILGIDYGAHEKDARRAVGRVMKRIRAGAANPYTIEDVTWALNEIERAETDPDVAVEYFRIPADSGAYERDGTGSGIFNPSPQPIARSTHPTSSDEWERVKVEALKDIARLVLSSPGLTYVSLEPYEEGRS